VTGVLVIGGGVGRQTSDPTDVVCRCRKPTGGHRARPTNLDDDAGGHAGEGESWSTVLRLEGAPGHRVD
jgi:hypothetical protein